MTSPDPTALAVWHALDVCSGLAGAHVGAPVLVSNGFGVVRWPAGVPIGTGTPTVELVVQSDGVLVLSTLRRAPHALDAVFVRYPMRGGFGVTPDASGVLSPQWRESLDGVLARALEKLPATGQLASP